MIHKVVNADDITVLDRGQKFTFGNGDGSTGDILAIQKPFKHNVAREGVVEAKVDPAQTTVGDRPLNLVLFRNDIFGLQGGNEGILLSTLAAKAFLPPQGIVTTAAKALVLWHGWINQNQFLWFGRRQFGNRNETSS